MDRRKFLSGSGQLILASAIAQAIPVASGARRLMGAEDPGPENPNWAGRKMATVTASSYVDDPPWGYRPSNVLRR